MLERMTGCVCVCERAGVDGWVRSKLGGGWRMWWWGGIEDVV